MTDREKNLNTLKQRDAVKNFQVIGNGESFIEVLEAVVNELKQALGVGVEFNNLDELITSLGEVSALKNNVTELQKAIDNIVIPDMPKSVEIKGLDDLIKATQVLSKKKDVQKLDISTITPITDQVGNLITAIEAIQIPKQGQKPDDYVPMRRVMKVGNTLMYDDSHYTGGGGGGSGIAQYIDSNGVAQNVGPSYPLPTTATINTGDIEIGAVEIKNGTDDTRVDVVTAGADAVSNTTNRMRTSTHLTTYNGTTWDRVRSGISGAVSTVLGYINVIPVGRFNATPPTLTDGQYINPQVNSSGSTRTTEADQLAGEDLPYNRMTTILKYSYTNITTNATTTAKSGPGFLHSISVNNPALLTVAALTITVYDNTAGSGTKVGTFTVPFGLTSALPLEILFDTIMTTGITIVTAGPTVTGDLSVTWL